jgi:hypothetical protein
LLVTVIAIFVVEGLYFSRTLVFSDDEQGYLAVGLLAARRTVSLYQDELLGLRMPLPFYVLGASQLLWGQHLWAARLLSLGFAIGVLWLTIRTGTQLGGALSGVLAGAFLATQGAIVAYFSTAGYHAFTAFALMGTLQFYVGRDFPRRNLLAAAATGVLFLTRTHVLPLVPFFLGVALIQSRSVRERLLVGALGALAPVSFFLWDDRHWKLLAYVPLLDRLVAPFGYKSVFYFYEYFQPTVWDQLWSIALFARRYESWVLAGGALVLAFLWSHARGYEPRVAPTPDVRFVAVLLAYSLGWLAIIFGPYYLKVAIAYFPTFAPLAAVLLGWAFSRVLTSVQWDAVAKGMTVVGLIVGLVVSVVFPRNPLLPVPAGRLFADDAVARLERISARFRELLPPGSRAFLVGDSMPLYLADRLPYLRQVFFPTTLAGKNEDPWLVMRNGVWGRQQIEEWLGKEAEYAVIAPKWLEALRPTRERNIRRIEELLASHFERVAVLDDYPWEQYEVYRRRL